MKPFLKALMALLCPPHPEQRLSHAADELSLDRTDSAGHPVLAGETLLQLPGSLTEAWLARQRTDAGGQGLGQVVPPESEWRDQQ